LSFTVVGHRLIPLKNGISVSQAISKPTDVHKNRDAVVALLAAAGIDPSKVASLRIVVFLCVRCKRCCADDGDDAGVQRATTAVAVGVVASEQTGSSMYDDVSPFV
jgi:hypothetical protein